MVVVKDREILLLTIYLFAEQFDLNSLDEGLGIEPFLRN